MSVLRDLTQKLEAATEGSRELDADIVEALWPVTVDRSAHDWGVWREQAIVLGGEMTTIDCFDRVKPYTASLDAALSLAPEGYTPWDLIARYCTPAQFDKNPALSLCIAALRAREAQS